MIQLPYYLTTKETNTMSNETNTGIKLPLHIAKQIRDNGYLLADSSQQIDKYDGGTFTRQQLDNHIYELEARRVEREDWQSVPSTTSDYPTPPELPKEEEEKVTLLEGDNLLEPQLKVDTQASKVLAQVLSQQILNKQAVIDSQVEEIKELNSYNTALRKQHLEDQETIEARDLELLDNEDFVTAYGYENEKLETEKLEHLTIIKTYEDRNHNDQSKINNLRFKYSKLGDINREQASKIRNLIHENELYKEEVAYQRNLREKQEKEIDRLTKLNADLLTHNTEIGNENVRLQAEKLNKPDDLAMSYKLNHQLRAKIEDLEGELKSLEQDLSREETFTANQMKQQFNEQEIESSLDDIMKTELVLALKKFNGVKILSEKPEKSDNFATFH